MDGEEFIVKVKPSKEQQKSSTERQQLAEKPKSENVIVAPMQGMVVSLKVKVGDKIKKGDTILVLEAMKMQTEIHSDKDGIVKKIYTYEGEILEIGDAILEVE